MNTAHKPLQDSPQALTTTAHTNPPPVITAHTTPPTTHDHCSQPPADACCHHSPRALTTITQNPDLVQEEWEARQARLESESKASDPSKSDPAARLAKMLQASQVNTQINKQTNKQQ
jgi:hypothetical protein